MSDNFALRAVRDRDLLIENINAALDRAEGGMKIVEARDNHGALIERAEFSVFPFRADRDSDGVISGPELIALGLIDPVYQHFSVGSRYDDYGHVNRRTISIDVSGANLDGADLRTSGDGRLEGVNFKDASLRGAVFDALIISRLGFDGTDLAGASFIGSTFAFVGFYQTDLTAADFTNAEFIHVRFSQSNLLGADLSAGRFKEVCIYDTNMASAKLSVSDFGQNRGRDDDTIFRNVVLRGSDLTGSNFRGVTFDEVDFDDADLDQSTFESSVLEHADLRNVSAVGANFDSANLRDADLSGAILRGASFYRAKIDGADFTGTGVTAEDLRLSFDRHLAKGIEED